MLHIDFNIDSPFGNSQNLQQRTDSGIHRPFPFLPKTVERKKRFFIHHGENRTVKRVGKYISRIRDKIDELGWSYVE